MSRKNSPIADVDRIAKQEGVQSLAEDGEKARTFEAWGRVFKISEVRPGQVGIFKIESKPVDEDVDDAAFSGSATHDYLRKLFRRAVKWKERVA